MAKLASTIMQIRAYIRQLREAQALPSVDDARMGMIVQLATERLILNISEATRRIPESEKVKAPDVPWQALADIGNRLRHDYDAVDPVIIRGILEGPHLGQLAAALDKMNPDVEQIRRFHPRPSILKDQEIEEP